MAAKKTNGQTGVEDEAPVKPTNSVEDRHVKLREDRRALEAELAEIDIKLRGAITDGDAAALASLNKRKIELPGLFIVASMAESAARNEILNGEDAANSALLQAAQVEREKIQATLLKRKTEFEQEIAALTADLYEADRKVGDLYATIGAARNFGADCDAAFKRSLSKLAGV